MECFKDEKPSVLYAAFNAYFEVGTFFPKPADIFGIIAQKRIAARIQNYKRIDAERTRQEQESPEWEASSRKARELLRELAGMKEWPVTTGDQRDRIKQQADTLRRSRQGLCGTKSSATLPTGK